MYAGLQDTAATLLEKFGQSLTLTKPAYTGDNQEWNPVTGQWETVEGEETGEPETGSVKTVFVGISQKWTDKFVIEQGDSVALVAADGLEPEQNDDLDGWTILAVEPFNPADTAVLYRCHVRKQ
jgi:hypothetical protein